MIGANPSSTERYHMATHQSFPLVLRRKVCACGKQITARQETQYGKCVSCVRAKTSKG